MAPAQVACCHCKARFSERALGGTWLSRVCPECGGVLSEEAYDAAAAALLDGCEPPYPKPLKTKLKQLALARYYTSEWFRLACAGQGSAASDRGLFGLRPFYRARTALFSLEPADRDRAPEAGWGVSAEYRVFDCLRAAIAHGAQPLSDALLLPNLVFPWKVKPKQWGARHRAQLDCLLLCRSCAIVVEVKRREHHVRTSEGFKGVRERPAGGAFKSAKEALAQVAEGSAAFAEHVSLYPEARLYRMLVYVDALSFESADSAFCDGRFVGHLAGGRAPEGEDFVAACARLVDGLSPVTSQRKVHELSRDLMERFGNTKERRTGRIVCGSNADWGKRLHRTAKMLDAIERRCLDAASPLHGARLLKNLSFEAQVGKRGKKPRPKRVELAGLLLTRTHAVLIGAKRWRVHVNTHAPFATVYVGDAKLGARPVPADIRHDWDLQAIHYENRSASLSLLEMVARGMTEVDRYRARNRVCTLNVFVDPLTFFTDREDFRSRTFAGYWREDGDNIIAALERLAGSAPPIMKQRDVDRIAETIASM